MGDGSTGVNLILRLTCARVTYGTCCGGAGPTSSSASCRPDVDGGGELSFLTHPCVNVG